LGGCKLAVIVVEGGSVRSAGWGTCLGGTICIVDVASPYFHGGFEAIADRGWYFQKWNSGDRFFCGGSTNPICELSFKGYEESKEVGDMVESSEVFYLMPIFTETLPRPISDSDTITVNGREWAQPGLFAELAWNDINAKCPAGICAGVLNGYDVTGWIWASRDDITALFNSYIGSDVLGHDADYFRESESEWLLRFFDDGWISVSSGTYFVMGLTRDSFNVEGWGEAYAPYIGKEVYPGRPDIDVASIGHDLNLDERGSGAWLYRSQ
jgi:hypothetical protein